ncbi:putative RNA polymerase II subunit B1 CTD phosphatase rpap2 [Eucyclogobius newberryi]|uniref:putative RNA polymerase II subunit B1 CTD phosphatase rpap2 n=1 Tax=Eucyclogobius newberryi TaxID=166745 RepID=UPI003B5A89E5
MAETEKSSATGILKTSKKGAKKSKALSAEEEARRREVVKEALHAKFELDKRALQIVERLLEDSVAEDFLIDCARFITIENYKDTIEERSIAKLCGYPICPNQLGKIPTQKFKISTKTNKVYDITERKLYCSNFCYKASKQFEVQISKTPLWLRQHESPPKITLLKKEDGGSSGEEIKLTERRLQEQDIENPSSTQTEEDPHKSGFKHEDCDQSDNEQEFVSSVVSKETGPKVHWGELPKRNEDNAPNTVARKDKITNCKQEINSNEAALDEATAQFNLCSLSGNISESIRHSKLENSNNEGKKEDVQPPKTDKTDNTDVDNITQVGMSKKGAYALQNLLKRHEAKPDSIRQRLLESLKKTLGEWGTDETLLFLYGSELSMGETIGRAMEGGQEEEELDEDDLEEEEEEAKATAAPPDYEALKREAELMERRVKEFYKGTLEVEEDEEGTQVSTEESDKEPILPLVDSKAQHVIQKKITVDKLSGCLKNVVCPLGLTMSDISTDLNNLVRTFRFTNKNIIHKTPEWTLIGVVLLHLLSEVSPLIRATLEQPSTVQYLNTLMEELRLKEEDLLSLVLLFKPQSNRT